MNKFSIPFLNCKSNDDSGEEHSKNPEVNSSLEKFANLVGDQTITLDDLLGAEKRAEEMGKDLEEILVCEMGLKRHEVGKSLEAYYGVPYLEYQRGTYLNQRCFSGLNKKYLKWNLWLPIDMDESSVVVLVNDPNDDEKIGRIRAVFPQKELEVRVGLKLDIFDYLCPPSENSDSGSEAEQQDMASLVNDFNIEKYDALQVESKEEESLGSIRENDSSMVRLVDKIILDAYFRKVSDIHIEPGHDTKDLKVRFRVDGDCYVYEEIPYQLKHAIISRLKIMANLDITERRLPQDGKFKIRYKNEKIEMRMATLPTIGGNEDVILRNLSSTRFVKLNQLDLSPKNAEIITSQISKPYGLVLVVGPTGSGKTTTLHSALDHINSDNRKIWTAEDPVEITQEGLRQLQINKKIGLDFPRAMRSFLRGDPDVIMVGEMRDTETASMAIEASLTGHLVFSTLHTNSAPETVTRLLNMGLDSLDFAEGLLLIVAQRLVKTLCAACKEDWTPSDAEMESLIDEFGWEEYQELLEEMGGETSLKQPVGCSKCGNSGYQGRTGLYELLEGTRDLKGLIMKKAPADELKAQAKKDGMRTLRQDGLLKIFQGRCDLKQVLAITRA